MIKHPRHLQLYPFKLIKHSLVIYEIDIPPDKMFKKNFFCYLFKPITLCYCISYNVVFMCAKSPGNTLPKTHKVCTTTKFFLDIHDLEMFLYTISFAEKIIAKTFLALNTFQSATLLTFLIRNCSFIYESVVIFCTSTFQCSV